MIRLVVRAQLTRDYVQAFIKSPEDREKAVRKLIEATGAKLIAFYFTTGDSDVLILVESEDTESVLAALMGAAARGAISNVSTARAWTPAEFKVVGEKASAALAAYNLPGQG